ncbi:cell division control protein 14 [Dissophora globulifera]|nr:cell division control protein 14 [Dissophora globulifera]
MYRLYFMWTCTTPANTRQITYLTIDDYLIYPPFFSDFGPFDIANVFRFCCLMKERFELARSQSKILCLYTKPEDEKRANAAFSICCYMMLLHNQTPDIAYAPLRQIHPAIRPFRDAGSGPCTYTLTILDSLRGLARGLDLGLLHLQDFDVKEYEKYEQVVHGDLNWITPFFIAFAGPKDSMTVEELRRLQRKEAMEERRKARADRERYDRQQQIQEGAGETNVLLEAWRRGLADDDSGDSATSGSESTLSSPGSSTMASSTSDTRVSDSSSLSSQSSSSSSLSSPSASSSSSSSSDDHSRSITPFPSTSLQRFAQPLSNGSNGSTLEEVEYEDHGNDYYTDTATATTTDSSTASLTLSTGKLKKKQPHRVRTRLSKRFQSVLDYFEQHGVDCVIRLSDKTYDEKHFRIRGIHHVDLVYPDGHCPPLDIVERFLEICEQFIQPQPHAQTQQESHEQGQGLHDDGFASASGGARKQGGIVAVHCMAGLGRTGTLIAVYLMRHYDMTAREAIAFLRLMRPGSVVGPQQNWLDTNEWWIRQSGNQQHRRHRATVRAQPDYEQVFSGAILGGLYVDGSCLESDVSDVENSVVSGLGLGVDRTRDSMALTAIAKTQDDMATSSNITNEYANGVVSHNGPRLRSSSLTPTLASAAAERESGLSDRQSRIQTKSSLPALMTEPLSDTSTTTDEDSEDIEETMAATQTLMVAEQEHIDNKAYVIPVQPRKSIHSAHHPRSPRHVGESLERASVPIPEQSQRITTPLLSNATMAMTSTGAKVSDGRTWSPRTLTSGSHHDRVPWAIRAAGLPIASLHSYHAIRNNTDNNNNNYNNSGLEKISDRHGSWSDKANYRNDNFGSSKSSHADKDDHVHNDTGNKNKVGYNDTQTFISTLPRKRAGVVLEDPSSPPSLNSDDNADDLSTTTASSSSSFSRQGRLQHAVQHPRKRRGHRDEMGL